MSKHKCYYCTRDAGVVKYLALRLITHYGYGISTFRHVKVIYFKRFWARYYIMLKIFFFFFLLNISLIIFIYNLIWWYPYFIQNLTCKICSGDISFSSFSTLTRFASTILRFSHSSWNFWNAVKHFWDCSMRSKTYLVDGIA